MCILAGPIIRKATKDCVYIWLAADQVVNLSAKIFVKDNTPGFSPIAVDSIVQQVQLAKKLHVCLICIRPSSGKLKTDQLLYYDIVDGTTGFRLHKNEAYVYDGEIYPSFIIASTLKTVLHGSCRKPHAGAAKQAWGSADQLVVGSRLIKETLNNPASRPSLMLLTGDQIYADDVAGAMLSHLISEGERLTGWNEIMPRKRPARDQLDSGLVVSTQDDAKDVHKVKLYDRFKELMPEWTGFTSGKRGNHLMTFGEYAAMYITVFGGNGAKPKFSEWVDVVSRVKPSISELHYNDERDQLKEFAATLPEVRKLLANISVYMLFDDHEVTDDWNITPHWEAAVRKSPRGRRVVSNALAAYWAFQGWGNDPEQYDTGFIDAINGHLCSQQYKGEQADHFDTVLWEKSPERWSYTIESNPPIVAMDTRTCRGRGSSDMSPVKLMNNDALDRLKNQLIVLTSQYPNICLISPTPVFGFRGTEKLQDLGHLFGGSVAALDLESWVKGFPELNAMIASLGKKPASISIFSGDVHYSFVRTSSFTGGIKATQFTSSPLHNTPAVTLTIGEHDLLLSVGFVASQEQEGDKHVAVTMRNNIAQVWFDGEGRVIRQQLKSILPDGNIDNFTFEL